jgi:hypothetical protein
MRLRFEFIGTHGQRFFEMIAAPVEQFVVC